MYYYQDTNMCVYVYICKNKYLNKQLCTRNYSFQPKLYQLLSLIIQYYNTSTVY